MSTLFLDRGDKNLKNINKSAILAILAKIAIKYLNKAAFIAPYAL